LAVFWSLQMIRLALLILRLARCWPIYALYRLSPARKVLDGDIERWRSREKVSWSGALAFFALMGHEGFRSVVYYRIPEARFFRWLAGAGVPALYINTPDIGPGLYFQHGFATIVHARSIGRNCFINQQVTVGFHGEEHAPVIGNNVSIRAGAKVIGELTVGDNAIVGAGAVVTKSVPPDCVVVGNPAYIVRKNGERCREPL